jgi:transposase
VCATSVNTRGASLNVAYHWLLGLSLIDKIIDASTFSQQSHRQFLANDIEQHIFDATVHQSIKHTLVDGDTHSTVTRTKRRLFCETTICVRVK